MRKFIGLILACLILSVGAFGSPLIFKSTKEVKSGLIAELGTIDTSKYKEIRVLIKREYKDSEDELSHCFINLHAVEDGQDYLFKASDKVYTTYSETITAPPAKIKITVSGQGKFQVFVWAS